MYRMGRMDTQRTLRASAAFWNKAKLAAVMDGIPMGELLEKLVDQHVSKRAKTVATMPSPLHRVAVND